MKEAKVNSHEEMPDYKSAGTGIHNFLFFRVSH